MRTRLARVSNGYALTQLGRALRGRIGLAFLVHVLTASGAALCLLALIAAAGSRWSHMFLWLGLALIVDALDGTFARYLHVAELLPRWSGDVLDLVVDFLDYVLVPAYAIVAGGLLPAWAAVPAGIVIVMTSAIYFADRRMKTPDNYFRGFPALWNIVAFYLFLLRPAPIVALAVIVALAGLTFAPYPFVHPVRVRRLRPLNLIFVGIWAALAVTAVATDMMPGPWVTGALSAIAVWFVVAGLLRRSTRTAPQAREQSRSQAECNRSGRERKG
jgi:phosphatidylcholine synthase